MAEAERHICFGSGRCFAFPDPFEEARKTGTAKGRCRIAWIISRGRRESWDV
jgi:hypothetical protein